MNHIFTEIISMSLRASYCILIVFAARLLLRKAPKIYSYLLWAIVAFRLLCPVSLESMFSLMRAESALPSKAGAEWISETGDSALSSESFSFQRDGTLNGTGGQSSWEGKDAESDWGTQITFNQKLQKYLPVGVMAASYIWLAGICFLLVYNLFSIKMFKKKICQSAIPGTSCQIKGINGEQKTIPVLEIESLDTPFVMGFIKPVIYLPTGLSTEQKSCCLAHECIHIRRKDSFIKQAAFWAVCIHWFNPLVWAAFRYMNKDMEMSCDEAVIRNSTMDRKKEYSYTLLAFASEKSGVLRSHPGFGETSISARVRNVLSYKKPSLWVTLLCLVVVAGLMIGLSTNAPTVLSAQEKLQVPETTLWSEQARRAAEIWAEAFSARDGSVLKQMAGNKDEFAQWDMVLGDSGSEVAFGFSSPWPWNTYYLSEPVMNEDGSVSVTVRYYAETSDPSVSVWVQTLNFDADTLKKMEDTFNSWVYDSVLDFSEVEYMDNITDLEAFNKAYLDHDRPVFYDYEGSGYMEAVISQQSPLSSADYPYRTPDQAAVHYLHLEGGTAKVLSQNDKEAVVRYFFADGNHVDIGMKCVSEIPVIWCVQQPQQPVQ